MPLRFVRESPTNRGGNFLLERPPLSVNLPAVAQRPGTGTYAMHAAPTPQGIRLASILPVAPPPARMLHAAFRSD